MQRQFRDPECACRVDGARRGRPLLPAAWLLVAWALAGLGPAASVAQDLAPWGSASNYVNIVDTKVEQLSNAVRITLVADGVLQPFISDWMQFWEQIGQTSDWRLRESKKFTMNLLNARSQVGRFVDVGLYPVSHLTLSVPTEAREGVGLVVALRLYVPARVLKIAANGWTEDYSEAFQWMPGSAERVDLVLSDTGREAIITVHTEAHTDVAGDGVAPPAPPAPREELLVEGPTTACRVRALNAPFQHIIQGIATSTGAQVALSPDVDKRLTVNLPPMPLDRLLTCLCRAACLDLAQRDGAYQINQGTVTDAASYWASTVRTIPLRYISVDDALRILPVFMVKYVTTDVGSNTLVAFGPPVLLDKIAADLAALDRPGKQIKVKALLVETMKPQQAEQALSALVRNGRTAWGIEPVGGRVSVGVVPQSLRDIELSLKALAQQGIVRTDVRPELTVLSGREARVFLGKQVYYTYTVGYEDWFEAELGQLDVGVSLRATPWTGDGVNITVPYELSADSILSRDKAGLPTIGSQKAQGTLRVRCGDTIIFSGIRSREYSRQRSTVGRNLPLLSDTFRADSLTAAEHEIIICLSAETTEAPPLAARPSAKMPEPAGPTVEPSPLTGPPVVHRPAAGS